MRWLAGGMFVCALVACGGAADSPLLDGGGATPDGGGADGGDGGGKPDAPNNCDTSKCPSIPDGFVAVRMLDQASNACPNGWTSADGVTNPVVADGACSCECNVTQQPSCDSGNIYRFLDDTAAASCGANATTLVANQGGCSPINGALYLNHAHYAVDAPPSTGGACSYDTKTDSGKVSATPVRVCAPPSSCLGAICDGPVCVAKDGDVDCPASFAKKTLVGSAATAQCSACGASCVAQGTCSGTLTFFTDTQCTTGSVDFTADSTCNAVPTSDIGPYYSYSYTGSLASSTCGGTPPTSTATAALTGERTICCQ